MAELLNLRPAPDGNAKPYQIKQLMALGRAPWPEAEAMTMPHRYHINLFWSDEDGCWIADVPDLTYCSAHGPTPEAALAEVETAIAAWLAV